jgi:hypothetical protein
MRKRKAKIRTFYLQTAIMRKHSLLLTILLTVTTVNSFAFDTWWHAECTRKAMTANGFSADARLATQFSNYMTDFFPAYTVANEYMWHLNEKLSAVGIQRLELPADPSFEFMHFDAIFTMGDIERNWQLLQANTIRALRKYAANADVKPGFRLPVLFNIIGSSLHTVQDFYSHSSWVTTITGQPIPTWYGMDPAERRKLNIYTGAYPDGSSPGHKNHGDINKDCSTRAFNKEAVEVAERASIEWVKMLMDSVTEVPWAELKAYNIQGDMVMKRFLVKLDATFLTTTSVFLDHWDGTTPVKFVFTSDRDITREKNMAKQALILTMAEYGANLAAVENTSKIPSPYWAGYKIYHITRDLAEGLMLNGKKYK